MWWWYFKSLVSWSVLIGKKCQECKLFFKSVVMIISWAGIRGNGNHESDYIFAVVLWSWPHLRNLLWLKHKIIQWKTRKWFLTLNYLKVNNKHVWTCMMLNRSTEQTMKQIIKIHEQQAMHIHISYEVSVSIILTFTHIYVFIVYSHQPS